MGIPMISRSKAIVWGAMLALLTSMIFAMPTYAQPIPNPQQQQNGPIECTTASPVNVSGQNGILTNVMNKVQQTVNQASENLYKGIQESNNFRNAIYAAMILYIVIYGVMFLLGMANLTLGEGIVRLIKIGFVMSIIGTGGWAFFNNTIRPFFEQGTMELINKMSQIMAASNPGMQQACANAQGYQCTLKGLDDALGTVFSMNMFVSIIGSITLLPYGPLIVIFLTYGMWQFLRALFEATWVFLMSMIGRALLFGLAPIFVACLMFQKTKSLFDGWLNQIINFCLQPIFLFSFLAFYVKLIQQALASIVSIQWCYKSAADSAGTASMGKWMAKIGGTVFDGIWGPEGPMVVGADGLPVKAGSTTTQFPISIIDVLIFAMLAQLAFRYTQVVVSIAREIAGSVVSLTNMGGALTGWFDRGQGLAMAQGKGFLSGATNFSKGGNTINSSGGIAGAKKAGDAYKASLSGNRGGVGN